MPNLSPHTIFSYVDFFENYAFKGGKHNQVNSLDCHSCSFYGIANELKNVRPFLTLTLSFLKWFVLYKL